MGFVRYDDATTFLQIDEIPKDVFGLLDFMQLFQLLSPSLIEN